MNDPQPRCYECESEAYFARVWSGDLPMDLNLDPCVTLCAKHAAANEKGDHERD